MVRQILACIFMCAVASAETLVLKTGKKIEGTYLGGDARQVRMAVADEVQTFSVSDISEIRFVAAPTAAKTAQPPRTEVLRPQTSTPAASTRNMELAAGTPIVIRMIDDIDSSRDSVGQTFKASMDEAVIVNGETVVPRGADVVVKLIADKEAGRLTGRTELTVDLVSLTVNGREIDINTQEITQTGASRTNRTGKVVGGTAALGAIIGAIAGGGKGAAIGGLSGAAAGGAIQVMTKGEKVRIPSETRLTFTLAQPLRI